MAMRDEQLEREKMAVSAKTFHIAEVSPISAIYDEFTGIKKFRSSTTLHKHELEALPQTARKEIAERMALDLARQIVKEYVGCVEHPDGTVEFGIDIRVTG